MLQFKEIQYFGLGFYATELYIHFLSICFISFLKQK